MFDISFNKLTIGKNSLNQKVEFKAFIAYPLEVIDETENGYFIQCKDCEFELTEDEFEISLREEAERPKKRTQNVGATIHNQDLEYFKQTGEYLPFIIEDSLDKIPDKIQKFLSEQTSKLQTIQTENGIKNMNPKKMFDLFAAAGGILIEENGEIKAIPFYQVKERLPKEYYKKLHVDLVFDSNEHDAEGKFVQRKHKTIQYGTLKIKIWK